MLPLAQYGKIVKKWQYFFWIRKSFMVFSYIIFLKNFPNRLPQVGDKIRLKGEADAFKVNSIESDTELTIFETRETFHLPPADHAPYEVLGRVDQTKVYDRVFEALAGGTCIGIFPEVSIRKNI